MSDIKPEPTSGETGTIGAGPAAPGISAPNEPVTAVVESPKLSPEQEGTSSKADAPKVEAPKVEAARTEPPHLPGKLMIMSPGDRAWKGDETGPKAEAPASEAPTGKRRMSAMAAVVALATVAGALGGALATAGLGHVMSGEPAVANNNALESTVARIDADIVALKASIEHTSKIGVTQFNKASDRLDKVEKAQAEPAAKFARLSETVEKLRTAAAAPAPAAVATAPAAKEVTGSVSQPTTTAAAAPEILPAKPDVGRLPTVEGWVLRDVGRGSALIESRRGMYEVYTGDPIPGLGRVDAIRKQDGRWVVVTTKGLIVARQ